MKKKKPRLDKIDEIQAAWRREAPTLNTTPISILGRIYSIANAVSGPISKVFAAHELERGEFDVLATLYRSGAPHELTPTDLYRQLLISSGGLTHRLKCLEKAGLIARVKSTEDGRSSGVRLTAKGRERALAAYRDDLSLEERFLEGLEGRERARIADMLRELHLLIRNNINGLA